MSGDAGKRRLLILGGTGEAYDLADAVAAAFADRFSVVSALAGRTDAPRQPAGQVRIGGFGGVEGLMAYLRDMAVDCVVDATHPFAAQMTDQAFNACRQVHVPYLRLDRPAWTPQNGDRWHSVSDATVAARLLPEVGSVAFLTVGAKELESFRGLQGVQIAMRLVDPPAEPVPLEEVVMILGRGPFDLEDERALLQQHRIDVLVTKNSGGEATAAKLTAAREAGIPVIMIERPEQHVEPVVTTIAEALGWLAEMDQ